MSFMSKHMGGANLLAGFLLGCWIGYKILPAILQPTLPVTEETAAAQTRREALERDLAATLMQSENIVAASVHLTAGRQRRGVPLRIAGGSASVTLTFDNTGIRPDQLGIIAHQIADGVDGIDAGSVSIFDAQGTQLNRRAVEEHERKQFWTRIALNVAKVLGILAALITLKFIIQEAAKRTKTDGASREPTGSPGD